MTREEQRKRVLDRAWKLQHEREDAAEAASRTRRMAEAAEELGLDPGAVEEAERQLAAEDAAAAEAAARAAKEREAARARLGRLAGVGAAVLAALGAVGAGAWLLTRPPAPVEAPLGATAGWLLDVSPGTQATVAWAQDGTHGEVGVLTVTSTAPRQDGTWFVNLDHHAPLDLSRHERARFSVRGEGLGTVRLFLEADGERWRSPPVSVGKDWQDVDLPLDAFDHQRRDGGWKTVGSGGVGEVDTTSFKVGHYMNPPEATGEVRIDALRFE